LPIATTEQGELSSLTEFSQAERVDLEMNFLDRHRISVLVAAEL